MKRAYGRETAWKYPGSEQEIESNITSRVRGRTPVQRCWPGLVLEGEGNHQMT